MLPLRYEQIVRQSRYNDLVREAEQDRLAALANPRHRLGPLPKAISGLFCRLPIPMVEQACRLPSTS
jgi:hypothetical protein